MNSNQMLQCLLGSEEEGAIFIDRQGIIAEMNEKAKSILGISFRNEIPHGEGQILPGDIVIIADTQLGEDDGDLKPEDLACIGIHDPKLKEGSCLLGMGVYKQSGEKAKYRIFNGTVENRVMTMEESFGGHAIGVVIDFANNMVEIKVDGNSFGIRFIVSYAHMVVLDGATGEVKFFQNRGYTVRRESVRELLQGNRYQAKDTYVTRDVVGLYASDLMEEYDHESEFLADLAHPNVAMKPQRNIVFSLNKRPLLASIYPVTGEKDEAAGLLIKITEMGTLERVLRQRNETISTLEEKQKELFSAKKNASGNYFEQIIGNSSQMREVKDLAYKVATRNCNVILTGESGTGKSMLAREIYNASGETGPFVAVDCSTIPPTLFESEMFGYVGGAFTGANPKGKMGFFESADGGVIFLDEIGEIPNEIQVKLLNVIQNREIYRVGSTTPIPVSVRIIAATNKNLEEEVARGNFRKDLYYRINVFSIEIPPLQSRKEDIYYFVQYFIRSACEKYGLDEKVLSNEALLKIMDYHWPGNVRELQNIIERAVLICDDDIIYAEDIHTPSAPVSYTLKEALREEERRIIIDTLQMTGGDKKAAMELLGVSKSVFYAKLKELEIES